MKTALALLTLFLTYFQGTEKIIDFYVAKPAGNFKSLDIAEEISETIK